MLEQLVACGHALSEGRRNGNKEIEQQHTAVLLLLIEFLASLLIPRNDAPRSFVPLWSSSEKAASHESSARCSA